MVTSVIISVIIIFYLEGMFLTWETFDNRGLTEKIGEVGTAIFIILWQLGLIIVFFLSCLCAILEYQYAKLRTPVKCDGEFIKSGNGEFYRCNRCEQKLYPDEVSKDQPAVHQCTHNRKSKKLKEFEDSWKQRFVYYWSQH